MEKFYAAIRPMFGGKLKQAQVDGIELILREAGKLPVSHKAYLLATTFHETAQTMQPIYERGRRSYFNKYEPGTKIGKVLGNTMAGDGYLYRGRGFVQLTGRANYRKAGLENKPDEALQPDVAAVILVTGCSSGWFTGRKLSDYLPGDYYNARRVVNGVDKAYTVAAYASQFEAALLVDPVPEAISAPPVARVVQLAPTPAPARPPTWGALFAAFVAMFRKG